jgi:E3 ubiquitin-protein ligase TRIP12
MKGKCAFEDGYTESAKEIEWLIDLLTTMAPDEQKQVLESVAGGPNLPSGGLGSLEPKFTITEASFPPEGSGSEMSGPTASISRPLLEFPGYPTMERIDGHLRGAVARDETEVCYTTELPGSTPLIFIVRLFCKG